MIKISYLCDGMACEEDCSCRNHAPDPCRHTTDISHAKNFKSLCVSPDGTEYYTEIDREEKPNNILVVRSVHIMKIEERLKLWKDIRDMKQEGVIVLPADVEFVTVIDGDADIRIEGK